MENVGCNVFTFSLLVFQSEPRNEIRGGGRVCETYIFKVKRNIRGGIGDLFFSKWNKKWNPRNVGFVKNLLFEVKRKLHGGVIVWSDKKAVGSDFEGIQVIQIYELKLARKVIHEFNTNWKAHFYNLKSTPKRPPFEPQLPASIWV